MLANPWSSSHVTRVDSKARQPSPSNCHWPHLVFGSYGTRPVRHPHIGVPRQSCPIVRPRARSTCARMPLLQWEALYDAAAISGMLYPYIQGSAWSPVPWSFHVAMQLSLVLPSVDRSANRPSRDRMLEQEMPTDCSHLDLRQSHLCHSHSWWLAPDAPLRSSATNVNGSTTVMIVKWMNKKLQWSQRLTMFDITMQWFPTHAATVSFLPEPWIRQSISARRSEASSFEAQKENNWSPCSNGCATLSPVPNGFDAMASTLPPLGSLSQTSVDEDSSRSWSDFGRRGWDPKWSNHNIYIYKYIYIYIYIYIHRAIHNYLHVDYSWNFHFSLEWVANDFSGPNTCSRRRLTRFFLWR